MHSFVGTLATACWPLLPLGKRAAISAWLKGAQARAAAGLPRSAVTVFGTSKQKGAGSSSTAYADLPAQNAPYSIVVTCFNEARTIEVFLDSLVAQRAPAAEIVIVDGGSSDGTPQIIERWSERAAGKRESLPDLRLYKERRVSIAAGRNLGAERASEDIIAFTDAGCEVNRTWAERLIAPLAADPAIDVSMGWYQPIARSAFARALSPFLVPQLESIDVATFLPSARSLALRRRVMAWTGGFPEWLSHAGEDSLFDYFVKSSATSFAFVPEATVHWQMPLTVRQAWRTISGYARGDAEGGKVFWGYYLPLIADVGGITGDMLLATFISLIAGRFAAGAYTAAAIGAWAVLRFVLLVLRYRPFGRGAPAAHSFLAAAVMCTAQATAFTRGLLSRRGVEHRRVALASAGHLLFIVPDAVRRGDNGSVAEELRSFLAERWYVTCVFAAIPKMTVEEVLFEHQFLELHLRSAFDVAAWWEKHGSFISAGRSLRIVNRCDDSLSALIVREIERLSGGRLSV